jgi:hypothetical protein
MITKMNPWLVFFLIIITLGLYFFIWIVIINSDIREIYKKGPNSFILIIFFLIPLVNFIVWLKFLHHIKLFQEQQKFKKTINILLLFFISVLFMPLSCALIQKSLNCEKIE